MDTTTGMIYDSPQAALDAGVDKRNLVELLASRAQAEQVGRAVALGNKEIERRAARRAQQKASRRANR